MRVSEGRVVHLAEDIAAALSKLECVRLTAKEKDVAARIARVILDSFKAEEAIEQEAERLAQKHARETTGMDQRKIVDGIKARLAKERGFPL
jgi:hypothetical protein